MKSSLILELIRTHYSGDGFDQAVNRLAEDEDKKGNSGLALEIRKASKGMNVNRREPEDYRAAAHNLGDAPEFITIVYPDVQMSDVMVDTDSSKLLERIITEWKNKSVLPEGMGPTNRILMSGPPGCGKTMTAKALAGCLGKTLAYVRLDGLVSMYLGGTGQNVGKAFDYALRNDSILFFDEFDSVASDRTSWDSGEAKRIVGSILQNMDLFPEVMVMAATNIPDSLDSAIVRRFDAVIKFTVPDDAKRREYIQRLLDVYLPKTDVDVESLVLLTTGMSYSDIRITLFSLIRSFCMSDTDNCMNLSFISDVMRREGRLPTVEKLRSMGLSLRRTAEITGIPRSTLSRHENDERRVNDDG